MRWLWVSCGFVLFVIGAIGVVVPLWPTTIFWIGAVFCLAESHPKIRDWIYARPGVGPLVRDFVEYGAISRKGKIGAIIGILVSGVIGLYFIKENLWLSLTVIFTFVLVVVYIITRPEN